MLYAKVVFGLPIEGPFDYIVPQQWQAKFAAGSRVWVMFGQRKIVGYAVGLSRKSSITKLKPVLQIIDELPLLNANLLRLTKKLSDYYCCSWGEAIETALPRPLRKGKRFSALNTPPKVNNRDKKEIDATLVHNPIFLARWEIYLRYIKKTIESKESVIILLPDMHSLTEAKSIVSQRLNVTPHLLYRKEAGEIKEWCAVRQGISAVVMGMRSAIFAPVGNPGLIIIDEEQNFVYKQEQAPHYNAREIAFMRAGIERIELVLGSGSPSTEMMHLAAKNKLNYIGAERMDNFPEVKIVDTRSFSSFAKNRKMIFSKLLEDAVYSSIEAKEKALLFLNRKGFATSATCSACGFTMKCARCNINLTYYHKEESLKCRYCNYKVAAPKICPECNAGYIRYSGTGIERIESELSAMFPSAVIKKIETRGEVNPVREFPSLTVCADGGIKLPSALSGDNRRLKSTTFSNGVNLNDADIFVATSAITKEAKVAFDLVGVLSIDSSLNHADLRSSEKAFAILSNLSALAAKKMIIQTSTPGHQCFRALVNCDPRIFYDEELRQRKELSFPPYRHFILVKLRGADEEKVKAASISLFEKLNKLKLPRGSEILSLNPGTHPKLRDNFYRQILIACENVQGTNKFLKFNLKNFPHSGIIVTVDVDPL